MKFDKYLLSILATVLALSVPSRAHAQFGGGIVYDPRRAPKT